MCWAYCTDNVKTAAQHVITLLTTLLRDESVSCNTGTTDRTVTPRFVTPCLLTFCSLKHSLHSDVILRPTIFSQRSSPERPESSLRRWRYINHLLTYLLTYRPQTTVLSPSSSVLYRPTSASAFLQLSLKPLFSFLSQDQACDANS